MTGVGRGVVRLIVPSADGRRVLATPNGLAGWRLPALAVDLPFTAWDDEVLARASGAVGAPVVPVAAMSCDCWVVTAEGRVPAVGRTWVAVDEADRLGADARAVRRWADGAETGAPSSGGTSG